MTKRDKITELEEQIEELREQKDDLIHEKEDGERVCSNLQDALIQAREKIADLKSKLEVAEKGRTDWMEKAVEWQNKYEKLDWERQELPIEPMEVAQMLINATFEYDETMRNIYDIDQLEQIAEHLMIYCKHNKEVEE